MNDLPLLGPAEIRELAESLDIRPTKTLGQNFVIDPNTIRRIVNAAEISPEETVLEVGPGLGSLTLGILDAAKDMVAVEIDPPLAQRLPHTIEKFRPEKTGDIDVVLMDALKVTELPRTPDALVANLPYNVAVPVLLHLFGQFPSIRHALVMVQDEVADRLSATPGSKIYGVPSVKCTRQVLSARMCSGRPRRLTPVWWASACARSLSQPWTVTWRSRLSMRPSPSAVRPCVLR